MDKVKSTRKTKDKKPETSNTNSNITTIFKARANSMSVLPSQFIHPSFQGGIKNNNNNNINKWAFWCNYYFWTDTADNELEFYSTNPKCYRQDRSSLVSQARSETSSPASALVSLANRRAPKCSHSR